MTRNLAALIFGDQRTTPPPVERDQGGMQEESKVVAWINRHPPDLPDVQNYCAACGEFIPVYDTNWVHLADGAFIHHGGKHGRSCFNRWRQMRREKAERALEYC